MNKNKFVNVLMYAGCGFLIFTYILASISVISTIIGFKRLESTVVIVAHTATTFTFIFAVYQFRINSLKEKQAQMLDEAKLVLERMLFQIEALKTAEEATIENLNSFISKMSNLGHDFELFFSDVTHEAYKRVLVIRWQDMYFNHFRPALSSIKVDTLIKNQRKLKGDFAGYDDYCLIEARHQDRENNPMGEYFFTKRFLNDTSFNGQEFCQAIDNLTQFKYYFLDQNKLSVLMAGLFSKIDIRFISPVLAVVEEKKCSYKTFKADSNA